MKNVLKLSFIVCILFNSPLAFSKARPLFTLSPRELNYELTSAIQNNQMKRAKKILKRKLESIDSVVYNGTTALKMAVFWGQTEIIPLLLEHHADPNALNSNTNNMLMDCIISNLEEVALWLVNAGANVHAKVLDRSLLWWAVKWGRAEIAKILIRAGALTTDEVLHNDVDIITKVRALEDEISRENRTL